MSVYIVTGKLGAGKTLVAVSRMVETLKQGRRVATNIDIDLSACVGIPQDTQNLTRLPDKPSAADMDALGVGQEGDYDEKQFGLVVLDELAAWMNSRTWSDKGRMGFINWCIHARHLRWAVIFIVQDAKMIDAQVRDALGEHLVVCKRTDRVPIPVVGSIFPTPKVHVGKVYYGMTASKEKQIERWVYRGKNLYAAYNTDQIFSPDYPHGLHTVISKNYWNPKADEKVDALAKRKERMAIAGGAMFVFALTGTSVYSMVSPEGDETIEHTQAFKSHTTPTDADNFNEYMSGATYQGSFETNLNTLFLFRSKARGAFDSRAIHALGGTIQKISECVVMVVWRDNTNTVVTCIEPKTKPKKSESILGLDV